MLNNYICALDISSSKIAAALAEIKRRRINNIFFETLPSRGIKRGVIIDAMDLVDSVSNLMRRLKVKSGINIKSIYANISGQDIVARHSHAIMPLAERGNKVITLSDIRKVNEQARILGSSLEEEIIHAMPFSYAIDSKSNILNPLGLYAHRLEVDLYLVCSKLSSIQSLTRAINQAGYEIRDLFFSGIATSEVIFNREFREGLNVISDLGSDITELIMFKDGLLRHIDILAVGGNDLTLQLSETLKIPFDLAEEIKMSYGMVGDYSQIKEDKEILVKKNNIYKPIKQKLVSEVLTAKTKLICQAISDTLEKNNVVCSQVNNFIATGRTILLEGFLETMENTLGAAVKLGRINNTDIISLLNKNDALSGQRYLNYITSLGIICKALKGKEPQLSPISQPDLVKNPILKTINRFKEIYQEYF